jgi:hypothetical protein
MNSDPTPLPPPAFSWERSIAPEEGPPITFSEEVRWDRWDRDFDEAGYTPPPWTIGPFAKFAGNPILAPTAGAWDCASSSLLISRPRSGCAMRPTSSQAK